jgi:hypothetical protein
MERREFFMFSGKERHVCCTFLSTYSADAQLRSQISGFDQTTTTYIYHHHLTFKTLCSVLPIVSV